MAAGHWRIAALGGSLTLLLGVAESVLNVGDHVVSIFRSFTTPPKDEPATIDTHRVTGDGNVAATNSTVGSVTIQK